MQTNPAKCVTTAVAYPVVGVGPERQQLCVSIYAENEEHAVRQFEQRYTDIGYRVASGIEEVEPPAPESVSEDLPIVKIRKRGA